MMCLGGCGLWGRYSVVFVVCNELSEKLLYNNNNKKTHKTRPNIVKRKQHTRCHRALLNYTKYRFLSALNSDVFITHSLLFRYLISVYFVGGVRVAEWCWYRSDDVERFMCRQKYAYQPSLRRWCTHVAKCQNIQFNSNRMKRMGAGNIGRLLNI